MKSTRTQKLGESVFSQEFLIQTWKGIKMIYGWCGSMPGIMNSSPAGVSSPFNSKFNGRGWLRNYNRCENVLEIRYNSIKCSRLRWLSSSPIKHLKRTQCYTVYIFDKQNRP